VREQPRIADELIVVASSTLFRVQFRLDNHENAWAMATEEPEDKIWFPVLWVIAPEMNGQSVEVRGNQVLPLQCSSQRTLAVYDLRL